MPGLPKSTDWKVGAAARCPHATRDEVTTLLHLHPSSVCSAQLREIAYGGRTHSFQAAVPGDQQSVHLEPGENLLELQIIGATLSPSALELLGEQEPSTFCTYTFFKFEMHCTPVVMGPRPKYDFTSKYVVNMDQEFLEYVSRSCVTVELRQKLPGFHCRTVAASRLRLQQLLEHDGKVEGTVPLVGEMDTHRRSIVHTPAEYWTRLLTAPGRHVLRSCSQAPQSRFLPSVPWITGSG